MKTHLVLTAAFLSIGCPAAQSQPAQVPSPATAPSGQMPMGHMMEMMRHMHEMMRGGMGGIHSGMMMRMLFAMMDSDSDGTVSLQEFQAAHERIFKAMDANKDGLLTLEELEAFMQGTRTVPQR
jgi:Ca2+-binding EF-hand superfamily protein